MSDTEVREDPNIHDAFRPLVERLVERACQNLTTMAERRDITEALTQALLPGLQSLYEARGLARQSQFQPLFRAIVLRAMRRIAMEAEQADKLDRMELTAKAVRKKERTEMDAAGLMPSTLRVLRQLALTLGTNAEIGAELNISPATVKTHIQFLRGALGGKTRLDLVRNAFRRGYIPRCPVCARPHR